MIRKGSFDIAVLSYTLSNETVQDLAELVREYCSECPVIAISGDRRMDREIRPDEMVKADDGPEGVDRSLEKSHAARLAKKSRASLGRAGEGTRPHVIRDN